MREETDLSCRDASFSRAFFISDEIRNVIISLLLAIRIHCNRREEKKQYVFKKGKKAFGNRIHTNNKEVKREIQQRGELRRTGEARDYLRDYDARHAGV
jgi:type IV secretory pathway TraG/TraD family ATPase VirD4